MQIRISETNKDSICEWINAGYAAGPYEFEEIPKDAKIKGICEYTK